MEGKRAITQDEHRQITAALRARNAAAIKEFIDADRARWSSVVKKLNISLD